MKRSDEELEARGARARVILDDDLVRDALDALETGCIRRWEASKTSEERDREWQLRHAAKEFRDYFLRAVMQGGAAANRAKEKERTRERWRRRMRVA